jgi:hypothetical protein
MSDEFVVPSDSEVDDLVGEIRERLQGKGPMLQGAALADIVSMYFAGHHPAIREGQLDLFFETVRRLIPVNEAALFKHYGGRPEGWEPQ